jgi:hypothetical protein
MSFVSKWRNRSVWVVRSGKGGTEGEAMRLYLKLAGVIAVGVLIQSSLRPAAQCAWEVRFAARCWLAHQLQDPKLEARLIEESRERLVANLRAWQVETPAPTVPAVPAKPATSQPILPPPDVRAVVDAHLP